MVNNIVKLTQRFAGIASDFGARLRATGQFMLISLTAPFGIGTPPSQQAAFVRVAASASQREQYALSSNGSSSDPRNVGLDVHPCTLRNSRWP